MLKNDVWRRRKEFEVWPEEEWSLKFDGRRKEVSVFDGRRNEVWGLKEKEEYLAWEEEHFSGGESTGLAATPPFFKIWRQPTLLQLRSNPKFEKTTSFKTVFFENMGWQEKFLRPGASSFPPGRLQNLHEIKKKLDARSSSYLLSKSLSGSFSKIRPQERSQTWETHLHLSKFWWRDEEKGLGSCSRKILAASRYRQASWAIKILLPCSSQDKEGTNEENVVLHQAHEGAINEIQRWILKRTIFRISNSPPVPWWQFSVLFILKGLPSSLSPSFSPSFSICWLSFPPNQRLNS